MRKSQGFQAILLLSFFAAGLPAFGQQEVVIKLGEGVPAISVAIPKFIVSAQSPAASSAAEEMQQALQDDLKFSRVFEPLPKSYYSYIRPLNADQVFFKDWDSIQAKILLAGAISQASGKDELIFEGRLFDVRSERLIVGKRYQFGKGLARYTAHKMADEIMKAYGERPVFTTKIVFVSNRDGNDELYMMDFDGQNQTRLTFNKVVDYMPAWSSDGNAIAFTSYRNFTAGLYLLYPYEQDAGKPRIRPVSTRGTSNSPSFSPNGKRLAFCSSMEGNANSEIYVTSSDGQERARNITNNEAIDTAPTWSPTSREIAFISDRGGTPQVYVMDAEGANVRRISFGGNHFDSPAWSPAGDRLVYVSRVANVFDLFLHNLRKNEVSKLTESNARNESPCWSPDGRHIIFSSNRSGTIQLYVIDYDGANFRVLTSKGQNKLPEWSN